MLYTYRVTGAPGVPDAYTGLVFCGTMVIYALHRLTGISRLTGLHISGRYAVILRYRKQILICGCLGLVGAIWFLFQLPIRIIWWLILPCIVSLMYVAPLRKRWRDYPLVKIFLLSLTWAMLTGMIPALHAGLSDFPGSMCILAERALYIFAVAVPFDMRDAQTDAIEGLWTLPHVLGEKNVRLLALAGFMASAIPTVILLRMSVYSGDIIVPYCAWWTITAILIYRAHHQRDDYYFSGLLDGTMILLPVLVALWQVLTQIIVK